MARNSSGTHSLPAATNPVVSGTTITPTWANGTLADVSAEITDSLSRSGKGGMTAPLRTTDGTVAAPAHAFTSETGTGFFRESAGVVKFAILGVYRWALSATTFTVNAALTAVGKITASAGLDVNGTLAVVDDGGTSKKVTVDAPTGLAADYALTLPTALPGSTLPVTMTSAGVLSTAQLVNAQQNFGTPSAATDVVINSVIEETNAAVTSVDANLSNAPSVYKRFGRAWFKGTAGNQVMTATGSVKDAGESFAFVTTNSLFTVPAGYRPSVDTLLSVTAYDASLAAQSRLITAWVMIYASTGNVRIHYTGVGGGADAIENGDSIYMNDTVSWTAA